MRVVDEPGVTSTKVSFVGPNGTRISHAAPPAAPSAKRKTVSRPPATPDFFFFLLLRLRPTIRWLSTLHVVKTREFPVRILSFDCIGQESEPVIDFLCQLLPLG